MVTNEEVRLGSLLSVLLLQRPRHSQYTMSMEESISLEETNKIRISLGLKPLTDDSAPANDKDKQAEDNYAKQRERETKEKESKYLHGSLQSIRLVLINVLFFPGKYLTA